MTDNGDYGPEPWTSLAAAFDAQERRANALKAAVCEYLLTVNRGFMAESGHPLVPPTAIEWVGDGIVAIVRAVQQNAWSPSDG